MKNKNRWFAKLKILAFMALLPFAFGCSENTAPIDEGYDYTNVPSNFPSIPFPADNPYSKAKVELGKKLFFEKMLSHDSSMSCGKCHHSSSFYTSNSPVGIGYHNERTTRSVMPLINAAYRNFLTWDGSSQSIEDIAYHSIMLPVDFNADTNDINYRLQNNSEYVQLFKNVFGENTIPNCYLAAKAIATYIRVLVTPNSAYDKYVRGDKSALTENQIKGMELFFSEKTNCSKCHSGFLFTDNNFHNTGLSTHYFDRGRYYVTRIFSDWGLFLTPSLRNVANTYPYYHDGSLATLEDVLEHYNAGGKAFETKSEIIKPLKLTYDEKKSVIDFLKSLTDEEFLNNDLFKRPE